MQKAFRRCTRDIKMQGLCVLFTEKLSIGPLALQIY